MEKVPLFCFLFFALCVSVACAGVDNVFSSNDKPCHVTVSCADVTALAPRDSFAGVDRMIDPPHYSQSRKNTNKWLQFAKLETLTLRGRGLIDGQRENLSAGQYKWVNQQKYCNKRRRPARSVDAIERLRKGRILVKPSEPKGHTGQGPHHH